MAADAKARGVTPQDITVVILDRPTHENLSKSITSSRPPVLPTAL
jgi:hypothetical protein